MSKNNGTWRGWDADYSRELDQVNNYLLHLALIMILAYLAIVSIDGLVGLYEAKNALPVKPKIVFVDRPRDKNLLPALTDAVNLHYSKAAK